MPKVYIEFLGWNWRVIIRSNNGEGQGEHWLLFVAGIAAWLDYIGVYSGTRI